MSTLNDREQSLVSLGAAIASNCVPCVEYHVPGAKKVGLTDEQIHEALRIADKVRRVPARTVLHAALARIDAPREPSTGAGEARCGCAGSAEPSGLGGAG
jgi:4-carboxymuconolactone decarboxylase